MAERSSELDNLDTSNSVEETSLQTREENSALVETETEVSEVGEEASVEADQIREQIEETRRGMSETIDAIQEKLSFSNISEQVQTQVSEQINNVVETAKDALYGKTADVLDTVSRSFKDIGGGDLMKKAQQNPTALALIGAGIGALLVGALTGGKKKSKKKNDSYRYEGNSRKYDYNFDSDSDDDEIRYTTGSRRELKSSERTSSKTSESSESSESTFQAASGKISGAASSAYAGVTGAASSAYDGIGDAASKTYEGVGSVAGKTYETVGSVAEKTYEGVGNLAGKTYETVGGVAGYTYDKASDLGGQMKVNYNHYIEENPLAVGAVALAIGAAIGFAIPLTRKENEYLGEYRDSVVEKAQATAQDAIGSVKQMASEAQRAITEEVKSKSA